MKPSQRSVGLGFDHLETVGGRDRYVRRMLSHQERMSKVRPVLELDTPKAAFGGGKFRTPKAAGFRGMSHAQQKEQYAEVREAFRRVLEVHGGGRKSTLQTRMPEWQESLAANLSRNRRLGSSQHLNDAAHRAELYHQQRRIASSGSFTERRKNK